MTAVSQRDGSTRRVLQTDDEPYVNPGLFTADFFPPEDVLTLQDLLVDPLPFGDGSAMAQRVEKLLAVLRVPGPVVSTQLAPERPLGLGVNNAAMVFRGPSALATKALVAELTALRDRTDWKGTAAEVLLAAGPTDGSSLAFTSQYTAELPPLSVRGLRLNGSQEIALADAGSARVTVVTGPPGTGKSQLVAGIVANQWLAGRSVLVASTINTAVDVAVERTATIDPALLIRTGNSDRRKALADNLEHLDGRTETGGMSPDVIRRRLEAAAAVRQQVVDRFTSRSTAEAELAQGFRDLEGLRTLIWREAADQPADENRTQLHALSRKAPARWFPRRRQRRILRLAQPTVEGATADDIVRWAILDSRVSELTSHLTHLGPADPDTDRAELSRADDAWSAAGNDALVATLDLSMTAARPVVQQIRRARHQAGAGAIRSLITRSTVHLKGWACTALAARGNFDLVPGMFDLLVVDEASQCAIAHILPLAYRARRIVVVGDPNQLSPIVSLSRNSVEQIAAACGTSDAALRASRLSPLVDSVFAAYAARVPEVHLLEEHYRCHPQIAGFINEHFYGGALRVLTDVTLDERHPRGLVFIDVHGRTERPGSPDRPTSGAFNTAEIDAVVSWVLAHHLDGARLGIVTPFTAQVVRIRRALGAALGEATLAASEIMIGTAHAFQGSERDVILFSLVLATDAPARTAAWVESQRNLVNVAVSRAKRALIVFGDAEALDMLAVPTLHALVRAARSSDRTAATPTMSELAEVGHLHSDSERRLYRALRSAGHAVRLKPTIEGYELDFAIDSARGLLNIEVDGGHHLDDRGRQRRQDLVRDDILARLGIRVVRVPAWRCLAEPEGVADEVGHLLR